MIKSKVKNLLIIRLTNMTRTRKTDHQSKLNSIIFTIPVIKILSIRDPTQLTRSNIKEALLGITLIKLI